MIIVIANEKGGVGKSTIATNLSVEYSKTKKVLLVDIDTTKVSMKFMRRRANLEINDKNLSIAVPEMVDDLEVLMKSNFDIIIVDAGGYNDDMSITALIHSDLIIIPTDLTPQDEDGTESFLETLDLLKSKGMNMKTVFLPSKYNPCVKRPTILKKLKDLNSAGFPILTGVKFYEAFNNAHGSGKSVCELNPEHNASECINTLMSDIEILISKG